MVVMSSRVSGQFGTVGLRSKPGIEREAQVGDVTRVAPVENARKIATHVLDPRGALREIPAPLGLVTAPRRVLFARDVAGARAELDALDPSQGAIAETTAQVEEIAQDCRFRDCAHDKEPGCAVQAALADGALDAERWRSFQKLQREVAHTVRKEDPLAAAAERKRWAAIHKAGRQRMRAKREVDD